MSQLLNNFENDEHTREAVKEFFFEQLDKVALSRVYNKEDTKGVSDAKEVIEGAFSELRELYGKDKKPDLNNQAR